MPANAGRIASPGDVSSPLGMTTKELDAFAAFTGTPHLVDPSQTVAVWFTDPPGAVVQFVRRAPCTVPLAQWMATSARARLVERFASSASLVFVLDLSLMDGRDPLARPIIVECAREFASRARARVVPPRDASRVYLAGIHVAASVARVFGIEVSIEPPEAALRALKVAAPARP